MTSYRAVMGIDPGVRGGLAVLDTMGKPRAVVGFKPEWGTAMLVSTVKENAELLRALGGYAVFIEKVGYKRGDGGKGAFTFGRVSGLLEAPCYGLGLAVKHVAPIVWQSRLNCLSGGNKNVTKKRAVQLFPEVPSITHATADALLLAEYGRLLAAGTQPRS